MISKLQNIIDCKIGKHTVIRPFVNLYSCSIGTQCMIGPFVEIQKGVAIGNNVRVQSHSFICTGVTIEDDVFIGHHVVFTNDKFPKVVQDSNRRKNNWKLLPTLIKEGASIGSNTTILPGITIGEHALVGAGSVVTEDVPKGATVIGNPARIIKKKAKK